MAALRETLRVLKPGGQAAFTTWKSLSWWAMATSAMSAACPDAPALPPIESIITKGYDKQTVINEKLGEVGFEQVSVEEFSFSPSIDADRFGEACGSLMAMVISRLWDKEDVEKYGSPPKVIEVITTYLASNCNGGIWDGKLLANIVLARRAK
jgi:ubiquinone/menaquinone biosynthesis C-methylase UbiE